MTSSELKQLPQDGDLLASSGSDSYLLPVGVAATKVNELWNQDTRGSGILCAVVDSGIAQNHPELKGAVVERYNIPSLEGRPLHHHGTHVAGTVGARGLLRGVAPECGLVDVRIYDENGRGEDGWVSQALAWINNRIEAGLNIKVVNLSLGGNTYVEEVAIQLAKLDQKGVAVVVAAGNDGDGKPNTIETSFPASVVTSIAVGAYDPRNNKVASFSESNEYLSCSACGVRVLSSFPEGYGVMDGTSSAAPHVSGFLCLLFQKLARERPDFKGRPLLQEVKRLLRNSTVNPEGSGYSREYGYGYLTYKGSTTVLSDMEKQQTQAL